MFQGLKYFSCALLLLPLAIQASEHSDSGDTQARADERSAITRRIHLEAETHDNPFVITPHKPTYVLPIAYNKNPNETYNSSNGELDQNEMKFQVSFKTFLARGLFDYNNALSFGYTNTSWWQAYNHDISAPFRETNHEPEIMFNTFTDFDVLGLNNRVITLGLSHQSNGQSGDLSRSWNRLYAQFVLEKENFYFSFKPWWRLPESTKQAPDDPIGDDNPDIDDYMGNFELSALYYLGRQTYGVMVRNNLQSDNRGAIQFDWTFPISKRVRGYLQYFNGYGESLIDYNHYTNRVGVGVMLTNWL